MRGDVDHPPLHLVHDATAALREAAWLDALHRDLARDTAESAYLELWAGRPQGVEIAAAALERIVDYAAAIMSDIYEAIRLTDQEAITRGRAIMRIGRWATRRKKLPPRCLRRPIFVACGDRLRGMCPLGVPGYQRGYYPR